ncbi:twin-arginine translocase TatA/TatE family subunit [Rhizobium hidalgonense]|uniref:twin-arginine translocase TatA/TatE family subunit n=1 Tax=Rhizobium hidalgonense TaxID=1538159 RepID=UPI0028716BCB|nr:twin-arginine translocase TatA/TatE family subunit [Rhizobium hidalgonense]MDR9804678.1 twin-arginine translocase TatA/TatE family subunit [Rhizobium hidalgonense]
MGSFSAWHWIVVMIIVLILFGRGKIPELMADVAHGIMAFKKGMKDDHAGIGIDANQRKRPSEQEPDIQ